MEKPQQIETRSLIMDAKRELILPDSHDKITFVNHIDSEDLDEDIQTHTLVEEKMKTDHDMWPLLTQRYLGEIGLIRAYLLTPGLGKNPARNFTWRRRTIGAVADRLENSSHPIDPVDTEIFNRFINLQNTGTLYPSRTSQG